ncbi:MAG TPA: hypothetical protein VMS94_02925 [Acidobacteriota bacterium]|nr:hypothetical protein [Acidobacteriota bacterium]
MYAVWIKINETLPWIELEKEHQTRSEATKEAKKILNHAAIKIVKVQRKTKRVKVLVTAR